MPALALDGGTLGYEDYGAGPVVVLLHGSPGTGRAWQRVGRLLADRYRVLAPDLPGYGETPRPAAAPPGPSSAAALIEGLVGAVGRPVVLAGHSYGGGVALSVALRGRVAIGGLALFEAVALPVLRAVGELEAYAAAKRVIDDYLASAERGEARAVRKMVEFWYGPGAFERMPEPVQTYLVEQTAANVADVRATFGEDCPLDALRALAMPVLTVYGGRSPDVTGRIAGAIAAEAPRGSVVRLDEAGHGLTTTHAEAVAGLIADLARR